jgi:hypothetical protein
LLRLRLLPLLKEKSSRNSKERRNWQRKKHSKKQIIWPLRLRKLNWPLRLRNLDWQRKQRQLGWQRRLRKLDLQKKLKL